jgi:hypothetical protein
MWVDKEDWSHRRCCRRYSVAESELLVGDLSHKRDQFAGSGGEKLGPTGRLKLTLEPPKFLLDLCTQGHVLDPILLPMMDEDSFESLLNLEDHYYQEGYDLGEADGAHAGLVEGKLFGVEKGFEKAMSMGRLSGRADVWRRRFRSPTVPSQPVQIPSPLTENISSHPARIGSASNTSAVTPASSLPPFSANARVGKHIENLSATTDSTSLSSRNTDEAVADVDERLAKAMAKAKVITNIIAEPLHVEDASNHGHRSIEEAGSLPGRH